jgi:hypothetical protein
MARLAKQAFFFVLVLLPLEIIWNAVLGWGGDQIANALGLKAPTVSQVYKAFVELGWPLIATLAAFIAYHLWWASKSSPTPAQVPPVVVARDNPAVTYQRVGEISGGVFHNCTIIINNRGAETRVESNSAVRFEGNLETTHIPATPQAFLRFDVKKYELLDAANISSLTDNGRGSLTLNFTKPLSIPSGTSLSAGVVIASVLATNAQITFDETKTGTIHVQFGGEANLSSVDSFAEADRAFQRGFDRTTNRHYPSREASLLQIVRLREEGVQIRNEAISGISESTLAPWLNKVGTWRDDAVDAIRPLSEAESIRFRTLDTVPPARVQAPVLLTDQNQVRAFVSAFNQHDLRLVRLDDVYLRHRD